ncbi:MAG TPA: hypothetical protein VNX01_06570, partial [Bacteroidia bacterium]|nr:hypothetical protein [Bacteroidia bacterium]
FFFESISNAKRGKMTVAYALFRKPFMDELLILEQLLFDPNEFIQKFYHIGDPDNYDPGKRNIDRKNIIKNALSKIKKNLVFREELIFNLRYNKGFKRGFNGVANQALHIVTGDSNYKTENQELNFIFSDKEDIIDQWDHYYYSIPYLLIYSAAVVDSIVFNYLPDLANQNLKAVKALRRMIGTILWTEKTKQNLNGAQNVMYKAMSYCIKLDCKKCKKTNAFTKADFVLFFETEEFYCHTCSRNLLTTHESVKPIKEFIDNLD